jgi:hypothetical protein
MRKKLKYAVFCNLKNIPGWRTKRKIVVIESDDWGSVRMPSIESLHRLINKEISFNLGLGYDKYDTIASPSDLEALYEVLGSVKDKNSNSAIITANCVVANPDFDKIKDSNFTEYHYEMITETMKKYYPNKSPFSLWKQGIENNLFYPQFHGREHLNVQLWLKSLITDLYESRVSFDETVFSQVMNIPNDTRTHVLAAYDYSDVAEQQFIKNSIKEGLNIFELLFGYRSASAISPCYVWDDFIEKCYFDEGIKFIQGGFFQNYSIYQKQVLTKKGKYRFCGKKGKYGHYYLVRNCFFEPSQCPTINYVDDCLNSIMTSFRWGKPAIISSHRLNFVGGLNIKNRDENLKQFKQLLKCIIRLWPDVEFLTSDKLGTIIKGKDE